MGFVAAPATCAECHVVDFLNLRCPNCRLNYCEDCARGLHFTCPVCKGHIGVGGL